MLKFAGISGYDQMVINSKTESSQSGGDSCKWTKQKRETFNSTDIPRILVTQRHVFAAHLNSIIILDTKPLCDTTSMNLAYADKREVRIDDHSSPVTCFGVEEESLLLCSCSDEHVFLSKWDSLLGHWDTKGISEADGRILSCSIAFRGLFIYITLFKSDVLIVYKVASAHPPVAPGPLILSSIECLLTLEKVKELTTWSRSIFFKENLNIVGIASGNTVSIKVWEVQTDQDQNPIKLKSHRMVSYLKTISGADLVMENDEALVLVVGNDGVSEVFSLAEDALDLLYRFKIEEPESPLVGSPNTTLTAPNIQVDSRILCAKFFLVNFTSPSPTDASDTKRTALITDFGGDGDAKFSYDSFKKLSDSEKEAIVGNDSEDLEERLTLCQKLILVAVTTKGVIFIDVVSGQIETVISHGEILKDDTIFIQNAEMTVNAKNNEIILGLQSCLTRIVFSRRFTVLVQSPGSQNVCEASLVPREALSSRSVLRKKIKSPPRQLPAYPNIKGRTRELPKSPGTLPSWARSRSRPQLKSSTSKTKISGPLSARSHSSLSSGSSNRGFLNVDSDSLNSRAIPIPATGSYESDEIAFPEAQKITMANTIPPGISILRIAATNNGKHLAFGGSFSPLVITKTQPFQNYRVFKDVSKVTSAHFNFEGNLLLVASGDCRTTLVDWRNSKELLSFDFTTKFNEHVHSQFYFMDKFIVQPEENKVALYSYAKRDNGFIKLKAGEFQLPGQAITALAAANQFYSNMIITGLSNKSIQIFDTNAEKVSMNIPNTHTKPISCIRINEAPQGLHATSLCDIFLTSTFSSFDPIKLWDLRSAKCIIRISDINQTAFVPTSRPNISPCGRYIISGLEDNTMSFYDVRKIKNRLHTAKKIGSTMLDCCFDTSHPMVWGGCRNGSVLNFHIP